MSALHNTTKDENIKVNKKNSQNSFLFDYVYSFLLVITYIDIQLTFNINRSGKSETNGKEFSKSASVLFWFLEHKVMVGVWRTGSSWFLCISS